MKRFIEAVFVINHRRMWRCGVHLDFQYNNNNNNNFPYALEFRNLMRGATNTCNSQWKGKGVHCITAFYKSSMM